MEMEGNGNNGDGGGSNGVLQYQCKICQKVFKNGKALGGHQKAHTKKTGDGSHPWEENPRIPCPNCVRTYASPRSLYNHRRKHHRGDQPGAPPPPRLEVGESSRAAAARGGPPVLFALMPNQGHWGDTQVAVIPRRPGKALIICENDNQLNNKRLPENRRPSKRARTADGNKGKGKAPVVEKLQGPFPCEECGRLFKNRYALAGHKSHPHRPVRAPEPGSEPTIPETTTLVLYHGESSRAAETESRVGLICAAQAAEQQEGCAGTDPVNEATPGGEEAAEKVGAVVEAEAEVERPRAPPLDFDLNKFPPEWDEEIVWGVRG